MRLVAAAPGSRASLAGRIARHTTPAPVAARSTTSANHAARVAPAFIAPDFNRAGRERGLNALRRAEGFAIKIAPCGNGSSSTKRAPRSPPIRPRRWAARSSATRGTGKPTSTIASTCSGTRSRSTLAGTGARSVSSSVPARNQLGKPRSRRYGAGIGIALAFFAVSVFNLHDYGLTIDETESFQAGGLYLNILKTAAAGQPPPSWSLHQLPGYYFVVDVLRSGFTRLLSRDLRLMDWVLAFHLFQVLVSTLAVFLVYALAYEVSGRRRIATLAALTLALLPQFVAHSQNNPKDMPGLLVLVLAAFLFAKLQPTSARRDVWFAALALGVALTTHVSAVLLMPVLAVWQIVSGRKLPF